jgi:hypothetical protein
MKKKDFGFMFEREVIALSMYLSICIYHTTAATTPKIKFFDKKTSSTKQKP